MCRIESLKKLSIHVYVHRKMTEIHKNVSGIFIFFVY